MSIDPEQKPRKSSSKAQLTALELGQPGSKWSIELEFGDASDSAHGRLTLSPRGVKFKSLTGKKKVKRIGWPELGELLTEA